MDFEINLILSYRLKYQSYRNCDKMKKALVKKTERKEKKTALLIKKMS